MTILRQSLLVLLFGPIAALQAQPSADEVSATVLAQIEEQHRQEQKAFVEGDCDKVASFFSDEATRYANGRRITSRQEGREFCNSIPRPFGGRGAPPEINDTFHVLSESAAYFVRTIEFAPPDDEAKEFKREVVTKVWLKSDDEWKIVHFHSSVHSVSPTAATSHGARAELTAALEAIAREPVETGSYDHGPPPVASPETGAAPQQIQDGWRTAAPAGVGFDPARLEELTRSLRRGEQGSVHALLIEKDGRLVYEEYFTGEDETWGSSLGTVTFGRASLHDLRSAAKSVVSTLIGIAIGGGEIPSVEARLRDLLPEYAALLEGEKAELRLQHVLSMSAGLLWDEWSNPYSHPQNPWQQLTRAADPVAFLLGRELVHEPGSTFTYNTGLTYLLAAILKRATGERVDDYARRVLFEPLGIRDVVWLGRVGGRTPPADAGLRLRARDFAKIGSLFLHEGRWNGEQIVPEAWVAEAPIRRVTTPPLEPVPDFGLEVGYGYQWWSARYATSHGEVDVHIMYGNGQQRVMVVPELSLAVTMFAGHYDDPSPVIAWMPDQLLVEHIIDALIPVTDIRNTQRTQVGVLNGRYLDRQDLDALLAPVEAAAAQEPSRALPAQPSGVDREVAVRAEIEERHRQEQKAFVKGDCDEVVSFYSEEATIYANGRRITSLQAFREFCTRIPRPFRGEGEPPEISDNFYVLSDNAAYFVRTIDFAPPDDEAKAFKRELVTKVWSRTDDGWKIVHFHSSVHSVADD